MMAMMMATRGGEAAAMERHIGSRQGETQRRPEIIDFCATSSVVRNEGRRKTYTGERIVAKPPRERGQKAPRRRSSVRRPAGGESRGRKAAGEEVAQRGAAGGKPREEEEASDRREGTGGGGAAARWNKPRGRMNGTEAAARSRGPRPEPRSATWLAGEILRRTDPREGDVCLFHYPMDYVPEMTTSDMSRAFEYILSRRLDEAGEQLHQLELEGRNPPRAWFTQMTNLMQNASRENRDSGSRSFPETSWDGRTRT
ncbi:hypothetical protein ACHAWF_008269 [Thalassiosira exigua]